MKNKFKVLSVIVCWLLSLPVCLFAQTSGVVMQKQFGKQSVMVEPGNDVTFYDFMGDDFIKGDISNNSQSLTVFRPSAEGYAVQIHFEMIDLQSHSEQCPDYLNIYDGDTDADDSFVFAEGPFDITLENCSLPTGEKFRLEGNYKSWTYTSASPDGVLSVAHICRMIKSSEGWKAVVRCVPLGDMKINSAGTTGNDIDKVPACKYNVPFISFYADAVGAENADMLKSLSFRVVKNDNAADVMTFGLYHGTGKDFDINHKINAEISNTGGDEYIITLSEPIESGHDVFTLVGSFDEDSKVESELSIEGTGMTTVKHPQGFAEFANNGPVTVKVPAVEYMREGNSTISIGDVPITFYDNGGPGKMSGISEGTTTFIPEKKGVKIKIDFKNVSLYKNEYNSAKSEEIKIYDGSKAVDSKLVKILRENETAVVHSTSADGALTIKYNDNETSSFYKQEGFEAVVSSFNPIGMEVTGISSELSGGTACGGEKEVNVMQIVVSTRNTEPALTAQKFEFTTDGTFKNISSATLYYCGREVNMEQALNVGTANVTNDNFFVSANKEVSLIEGKNYFMLVYDISPEAADGDKISASVTGITVSDNRYTVDETSGEAVTVDNLVYSDEGRHGIVVSGRKSYRTRMHSSGETHDIGTVEHIYTFYPAHEGMKMQIDFNSFKLDYSDIRFEHRCEFAIYKGTQINDMTLMWEVRSEADAKNGPSKIIRSDSDDGAITVVFNPNTTSTAYCSEGFDAEVFEYKEQPMKVEDVMVKQLEGTNVKTGDKDVPVLDVNVRTMGDADDYTLDAVTINLKGSENAVSRIALYGKDKSLPLAEKEITASDHEVVLAFNEELLNDGDNHYIICYDVKDEADENTVLDASVTKITVSGNDIMVKNGDPDGCIHLKNIYNLGEGNNGEKTISQDSPLVLYDAGGFEGTCGPDFNGSVTFAPAEKDDVITLEFKNWNVAYGDKMYICHGESCDGEPAYTFDMNDKDLTGRRIISKSADGKITLKFVTTYNDSEGFEIEVRSGKRENLKITDIEAESLVESPMLKGSEDVPVIKLAITVDGNSVPFDITRFTFGDVSEKTVAGIHVFATGMDDEMYQTNHYGSGDGKDDIEGSYNISEPGTYNFFITADINTTASVGDEVSIPLLSVNGVDASAKVYTVIKKGVSGVVKVGPDEEYTDIQQAVDALEQGIDGPVTISVAKGTYKVKTLNIPEIKGSSSNNTVTISSESGDYRDVVISGYNFDRPDDYDEFYGVVTINGADHVTLKNLEITATDKQYPAVVRVQNHSCHATIDSCYVHAEMVTSFKDKIVLVETSSTLNEGQNTDYLTVSNSILEGARIGIRFAGASSINLSDQRGNKAVNNILRNQGMIGIYCIDVCDAYITGNTIVNDKTDASEFKAFDVDFSNVSDDIIISGNRIKVTADTRQTLMYIRNINASDEHHVRIFNNEVSGVNGGELSHALVFGGSNVSDVEFAYNTFYMNGSDASSLVYVRNDLNGVDFVNNLFVNRTPGTALESDGNTVNGITFRSDVFDTANDNVISVGGAGKTFEEFVNMAVAGNCYKESVNLFSDDVLEPVEKGSLLNAEVLSYADTDITGTERDAMTPTIGAYEYVTSDKAPVMKEGYPKVKNITSSSAVAVLNTNQSGKAYIMAVKDGAQVPDAETLRKTVARNIVRNTDNEITVVNLEKNTAYSVYALVDGIRGNAGPVYKSGLFSTTSEESGAVTELVISAHEVSAEKDSPVILEAVITGGKAPYNVEWTDNLNNVIKTETLDAEGTTKTEVVTSECNDYKIKVTDALNKSVSEKVRVVIVGESLNATFENLYLKDESYWNGSDLGGSFVSGSYKFHNSYDADWKSWGEFGYSNVSSSVFESYGDSTAYANAVGGGYDGSDNYVVAYCMVPAFADVLGNGIEGDSIRGFYVTNSAVTYKSIMEGDAYAHKFDKGDYLILTITNTANNKKVDYYLADYRSENEADRYVLDTWQWVDLRSLGKAANLMFTVSGSDNGDFGLNTPAYFCMDDFNGQREITEVSAQVVTVADGKAVIDMSQFFSSDNNNATITYSVDDIVTEGTYNVSAEGHNLVIEGSDEGTVNVVVKAVQKGRIQYVRIPLTITSSTDGVKADNDVKVRYRYTVDGKRIDTNGYRQGINIIRNTEGGVKKVVVR